MENIDKIVEIFIKNNFNVSDKDKDKYKERKHSIEFEYANDKDVLYLATDVKKLTIVLNPDTVQNNLELKNKCDKKPKIGSSYIKFPEKPNDEETNTNHYGYPIRFNTTDELDSFLQELRNIFTESVFSEEKENVIDLQQVDVPIFSINDTVENKDIVNKFKCGNMGGMRRSRKTNTLVIISDHTKGLYDDKWFGDVLHYTGMGKSGHQDINFAQNKTLAESNINGVDVHLFEVLKPGQYIYLGQVQLIDKPYQENQVGEDGLQRKVWMFPIRLKSGEVPINHDNLIDNEERKQRQARKLSTEELRKRAENNKGGSASIRATISSTYIRDPYVIEYAKRVANGYCQLCGEKAPFNDNNGNPYLETHHIVWLSRGGEDTIENTAALCPNCHRKMHIVGLKEDIEKLLLVQ